MNNENPPAQYVSPLLKIGCTNDFLFDKPDEEVEIPHFDETPVDSRGEILAYACESDINNPNTLTVVLLGTSHLPAAKSILSKISNIFYTGYKPPKAKNQSEMIDYLRYTRRVQHYSQQSQYEIDEVGPLPTVILVSDYHGEQYSSTLPDIDVLKSMDITKVQILFEGVDAEKPTLESVLSSFAGIRQLGEWYQKLPLEYQGNLRGLEPSYKLATNSILRGSILHDKQPLRYELPIFYLPELINIDNSEPQNLTEEERID